MIVNVAVITSKYGCHVVVGETRESMQNALIRYCKVEWSDWSDDPIPPDHEIVKKYFGLDSVADSGEQLELVYNVETV